MYLKHFVLVVARQFAAIEEFDFEFVVVDPIDSRIGLVLGYSIGFVANAFVAESFEFADSVAAK